MFRITARSLWEHKRRLVSTLIAIVLGVAFMSGTLVLTNTINRTFDDLFTTVNDGVDAQVQGKVTLKDAFFGDQRALLDPSLVDAVRAVPGVHRATPFVQVLGFGSTNRIIGRDGKAIGASQGPPTLFQNWITDETLTPWHLAHGRAPTKDDEIAINVAAAEDGHLAVGDEVPVVSQFGRATYKLTGTYLFGTAKSSAGAVAVSFTLREAERLAGTDGQIQQVIASADPGLSQAALTRRIAPILPPQAEVLTGVAAAAQQSSDVQKGFGFFKTILLVFAGVALLVGVFVISNTFSILVAQRTRELALLRAVGARRAQVLRSVLLEASLVGAFAALVGLGAGIGLAKLVTKAFEASGADLPTNHLTVGASTVITALVVGIVVTLIAAAVPALRATRVKPIAALRDVAVDRSGASRGRIIFGAIVILLGLRNVSRSWTQHNDKAIGPVGLGALLLIVGAIVVGPVLAGPSVRLIGRGLVRLRGVTGRLAMENAARSPKRTSATASALLIAVALIVFITVAAASAKRSVTSQVSRGFRGDFVVQSSGSSFGPPSGFPATVADEVAHVKGVDLAVGVGFSRARLTYPDGKHATKFVTGVEPRGFVDVLTAKMVTGRITSLTEDGAILDTRVVQRHHLELGSPIRVAVAGGKTLALKVEGISDDPQLLGDITVSRTALNRASPQQLDIQVFGKLRPGTSYDAAAPRIERAIHDVPSLKVLDRKGFEGSIAGQLTQFVTFLYVLLGLSVIIALVGIVNTLALSIHERTRELGLLRAVGMHRAQLRSAIRWEAVLISILGTLVGLGLGVGLCYAITHALGSSGLDQFSLPVGSLVTISVLAVGLGTLASVLPARRAARLAILDAIATE
jgi:putative ABC transport system permease protein